MNNEQKKGNVSFSKYPKYFIDQFLCKPKEEAREIDWIQITDRPESKYKYKLISLGKYLNTEVQETINTVNTVNTVNTISTKNSLNVANTARSLLKSYPKIKVKTLSMYNEPPKKPVSSKNTYRINFFSPQSGKLKSMQNLTDRQSTSVKQTAYSSINRFSKKFKANNTIVENIVPKAAGSNNNSKFPPSTKNSKVMNNSHLNKYSTSTANNKQKNSKFINVHYNYSAKNSNLNSAKPKEKTKEMRVNYKPLKKSFADKIINSGDLSIDGRQKMLKKKSHNTFISMNQTNLSPKGDTRGNRKSLIQKEAAKLNGTYDFNSDSIVLPLVNRTENNIKTGFINNKYKGLIDQFFNETRDKLISIQIEE